MHRGKVWSGGRREAKEELKRGPGRNQSCPHLHRGFTASSTLRNKFLLLLPPILRYSLWQVQQVSAPGSCSVTKSFAALWTVARQTPPSTGFPRQKAAAGCHFCLRGVFPTQGSKPTSLALYCWATGESKSISRSVVSDSATPWTVARQASLSLEFSSKNTGVGCHRLLQQQLTGSSFCRSHPASAPTTALLWNACPSSQGRESPWLMLPTHGTFKCPCP